MFELFYKFLAFEVLWHFRYLSNKLLDFFSLLILTIRYFMLAHEDVDIILLKAQLFCFRSSMSLALVKQRAGHLRRLLI